MTGTALLDRPYALGASLNGARAKSMGPSILSGAKSFFKPQALLAALLVLSLMFAAAFSEPEEHELDGDAPASMQIMQSFDQGGPVKGHISGTCRGHCAAHAIGLPNPIFQVFEAIVQHETWTFVNAQWLEGSRSTRLDRPPRV